MNTLEVMRRVLTSYDTHDLFAIEAHMQDLRRAIEQAERQEPVAWITKWSRNGSRGTVLGYKKERFHDGDVEYIPLYTAPPQQEKQEPVACVSFEMREFLRGAAPLDGVWFGEPHPTERGQFWWRKYITAPPQRQPLTKEELNHLWETIYDHGNGKYEGGKSQTQRARAFEILKRIGGES